MGSGAGKAEAAVDVVASLRGGKVAGAVSSCVPLLGAVDDFHHQLIPGAIDFAGEMDARSAQKRVK